MELVEWVDEVIEQTEQIEWVDGFGMEIAEITLDKPCFLVIKSDNSEIKKGVLTFDKKNITMGHCTNSRILAPLRVRSNKGNKNLFFVPQFKARIIGEEKATKDSQGSRPRAEFSLHLKAIQCQGRSR